MTQDTPHGSSPGSATPDDFAALREVEVEWLSNELSRAIKNLAYPVGMGTAPLPYHVEAAAKVLFDRYAKMIEMARNAGGVAQAHANPVAWVIPGDDTASSSGWLDARVDEQGEFTRPLYAAPQPASNAYSSQEPVAWQFRQRSGVGKGPQSQAPWGDWCGIEKEAYDLCIRHPNKLVEVRALSALSSTLRERGPMVPWELSCQRSKDQCAAPECDCPAVLSTNSGDAA